MEYNDIFFILYSTDKNGIIYIHLPGRCYPRRHTVLTWGELIQNQQPSHCDFRQQEC